MKTVLLLSAGLFLTICVSGSVIVFTSSPTTVIQGLTDSAVLRCGLNDTAASASVIGRRDTARTDYNVDHVSSIVLTQNGVDVASVSPGSVRLLVNATNVKVTGDVSQNVGERGFLEVSLQSPTAAQIGEYRCEVTAVGPGGHGVIFKSNIAIDISQPTIADLVTAIQASRLKETLQGSQITSLQQTVATQQHTISSLQSQIHDLQPSTWSAPSHGLQARLLGGIDGNDGRWAASFGAVQLRYNGSTGMLCDDLFDRDNHGATVVCRMMGFSDGVYTDGNEFVGVNGTVSRPVDMYLLDDVVCGGTEQDLIQCSHKGWGHLGVCKWDEVAGVRCRV